MRQRFFKIWVLILIFLGISLSGPLFLLKDARADFLGFGWLKSSAAAKYHYALSVLYVLDGKPEAAIRELRRALRSDPRADFLVTELAMLYVEVGRLEEARDLCLEFLAQHPKNVPVRLTLGGILRRLNDLMGAIREYSLVLKENPRNISALFHLGINYYDHGDFKSAREMFEQLLAINPDHVMASFHLARVHVALKNLSEAEIWFNKTLALSPSFEPALLELANIQERQHRHREAIALYRRYLEYYPEAMQVMLRLAELYLRDRQYDEAEAELKKAAAIDDKDRELRVLTAILQYERGNYQEAYQILQLYLQEFSEDQRARYLFATLAAQLNHHTEALEAYGRIPPEAQMYVNAQVQMGLILEKTGRLAEAIKLVSEALTRKASPVLYGYLASLYEKAKMIPAAEETLKAGLAAFPKNIDLYYSLGVIYEKTDRLDLALAQMNIILKLDPDHAEALNFIGYCWADRGMNLTEAEELIKRALKLKPNSPHIIDSLGWVYFRQGKNDLAIKYLREALEGLPDDPLVAEHLGDALEKNGQLQEALEMYRRALKNNPESSVLQKKIADLLPRL